MFSQHNTPFHLKAEMGLSTKLFAVLLLLLIGYTGMS
jgi:hypothetical protein